MEQLIYFETLAQSLSNPEVLSWKAKGGGIIGLLCSGIPEEMIQAAGILPMRVRASDLPNTKNADAHLHRINCSYTRAVLESLLTGRLDFLDGLVTANSCDHHLRLVSEIEDQSPLKFFHYFRMNHTLGPGGKEWLLQEMKKLADRLERAFNVSISEDRLREAISIYNRTRRLMDRLNGLRGKNPPSLSGREFMNIALTGMTIPREIFNQRLEALLPELEKRELPDHPLPRLLIIGGACDSPEFVEFIESRGATVVADGLCFGLRHYGGTISETAEDPWEAIAERYLSRLPCPAALDGTEQSYRILKTVIAQNGVQGVVSARLKFCDHFAGGKKLLSDRLRQDHSIPVLELEREYNTVKSGQLSTRLQAFLEML